MKSNRSQILALCIIALSACSITDPETCYSNSDPSFTEAISLKLDNLNFPYTTKNSHKLCFKKSKTDEFNKITHQVEQYYRAVATVLKSKKDKDAVLSWLKESGTPYYTHENDRGTFIAIGSLTEDLATENAIKLDELVYGQ